MKRKILWHRVIIAIIITILLIMSIFQILGTNKRQTSEIGINTRVETNISENVVKTENNGISKICGLSSITCFEEEKTETDLVKEISARYEVDWKLIEAIVIHETGNRTSLAYKNLNNVGGLMGQTGLMKFDTVEESYEFMIKAIKTYYIDKGLTTIEQIGNKYCPTDDPRDVDGLNHFWVGGVKKIYEQL